MGRISLYYQDVTRWLGDAAHTRAHTKVPPQASTAPQSGRGPRYDGQEPDTERAFTDAEVTRLIAAAPNETLKDFMLSAR